MSSKDSAFAVIRRNNCVLLVRPRGKRRWQLPGGRLKSGESALRAARREVEEETGLAPRLAGLTGVYRRQDGSLVFVFAASVGRSEEVKGPRHEIRRQGWVPVRKAAVLLSKAAWRRLDDALRRPGSFRRRAGFTTRLEPILRLLIAG
jgi:ADP-ribose pyrophosphatase YjhB (NUDIX family)